MIEHKFKEHTFQFEDTPTAPSLIAEIFSDNYKVFEKNIEFDKDDVILDIGANEGMFSIMMSKCFPHTRIIAFEPVPSTYLNLRKNIKNNNCKNVEINNYGVGKKGQTEVSMIVAKSASGGSTALGTFNPEHHYQVEVPVFTLDNIFDLCGISTCRLLKMDIEGMEYDVLYSSTVLPKVDYMTAEFHMNSRLEFQARRAEGLAVWVGNQTNLYHLELCRMCE